MKTRILALVSDCYGVGGGIARYNQDLFEALAGEAEIAANPRSRSAKLRAAQRTDAPAHRPEALPHWPTLASVMGAAR